MPLGSCNSSAVTPLTTRVVPSTAFHSPGATTPAPSWAAHPSVIPASTGIPGREPGARGCFGSRGAPSSVPGATTSGSCAASRPKASKHVGGPALPLQVVTGLERGRPVGGCRSADQVRGDDVGLVAHAPAGVLVEQREHGRQRPGVADAVAELAPQRVAGGAGRVGPRPASRVVVHHARSERCAVGSGEHDGARGAVDGDAGHLHGPEPTGELGEDGVDSRAPRRGVLLVAGGAIGSAAAPAGERSGGGGPHRAVVVDGHGAGALGAEVDPDPDSPVAALLGHDARAPAGWAWRRATPGSMSERIHSDTPATIRYIRQ